MWLVQGLHTIHLFQKKRKWQRSGLDTINHHTLPETPYGKETKTQGHIIHKLA